MYLNTFLHANKLALFQYSGIATEKINKNKNKKKKNRTKSIYSVLNRRNEMKIKAKLIDNRKKSFYENKCGTLKLQHRCPLQFKNEKWFECTMYNIPHLPI